MSGKRDVVSAATAKRGNRSFGIRSRVVGAGLLAIGLVVGGGGWASTAKLSGAIIAEGKVTVKRQVKQVQHRDGGIVSQILVDNGDRVEEGDVLVRLDETQTRAELNVIRAQLAEYEGRRARLTAERDGSEAVTFEEGFESDPAMAAIAAGERRLFADNRATREAQRDQLKSQIAQFEDQVRGLEAQRSSNVSERQLIAEDLDRLAPLVARKLVEATRTRALARDLARIDGQIGEIEANIAQVKGQISEAELKILELDQQTRSDAQRELRDIEARTAELDERIVAAEERLSRMVLRAPIAGTVNELRVHTRDGVIAPGDTVMTIVPLGADLVVEARLAPIDIDDVRTGQPVTLRFSAFNQRTTPEIQGTVDVVGAAATFDAATGQAYYLATVTIDDRAGLGEERHLVPGMPVEVFLQTGERTALSYLVKPFTDQMMRSMREE